MEGDGTLRVVPEEGAQRVAELQQRSQRHEDHCRVCVMSRMEVHCQVWTDEGERATAAIRHQVLEAPALQKDPLPGLA